MLNYVFSGLQDFYEHETVSIDNRQALPPVPPLGILALTAVAAIGIALQTGIVQQVLDAIGGYYINVHVHANILYNNI